MNKGFAPHRGAVGVGAAHTGRKFNTQSRVRRAAIFVATGMLSAALLPSGARAADITWDGTTGDWNVPANWTGDVVPGAADNAIINNAGTANITTDAAPVIDIRLGEGAGNSGTVNHSAGTAMVNEWLRVGINGGTGTYTLSGTGNLTVQNAINIGEGGTGTLNVTGGTLTKLTPALPTDNDGDQWMNIGRFAGGNGTLNLSGGAIQINGPQNVLLVARDGASGTVNQTGGTLNVDGEYNIGDYSPNPGPTGVHNISNGTLTADTLNVGAWSNANGTLNISGSAVVNTDNALVVGRSGDFSNSTGTVVQTGGAVNVTNGIRIGAQGEDSGGATGVYTMSGGTLTQPDVANPEDGATWNHIGQGGPSVDGLARTGTFNLSGGTVSLDTRTHLGSSVGANGTVNQTGGTFEVRRHELVIGDTGAGTYNISAGTLRTLSPNHDMLVGHWDASNGTLAVSGSGLVETGRDLVVGNGNPDNTATQPEVGLVNQTGGTVRVAGNLRLAVQSDATGTYNLAGGVLDLTGGNITRGNGTAAFVMTGGRLQNANEVQFALNQGGGQLAVGGDTGTPDTTTVTGNYTLGPTGSLLVDLASGGASDVLDVNGVANLAGLLQLDTPDASLLPAGTTYTILTPDSAVVGAFSNSGLLFADNNQIFTISYTGGDGNDVVLTATNQVIPEPAAISVLGVIAGAGLLRRRSRR